MHRPGDHFDELRKLFEHADTPLMKGLVSYITAQERTMGEIASSLTENTLATKSIVQTLSDHINDEKLFQTQITTSYKTTKMIVTVVSALILSLGGYIIHEHIGRADMEAAEQKLMREALNRLTERVVILEALFSQRNGR